MFKPPFQKPLPKQGDPRKFAQHGVTLEGFIPLTELPRLAEVSADVASDVHAQLIFSLNETRKRVVTGQARAELHLVCQRCLEPVSVPVESTISLAIVWDEDAANALPEYLDPWIVGEGAADFFEMIEEELLLSLPAVAYHQEPCINSELLSSGTPVVVKKERNPFQVLEQLKSSPKS